MNVRTACTIAWLALCPLVAASAEAETFSVSYNAAVTSANGAHAAVFSAGQKIVVAYTLDPLVPDSNPDAQSGVFPGAVLSLSVSFPGLGVFALAGPAANVQTFNDAMSGGSSSDQVFFLGGPIAAATTLGGEAISSIEVDFLSQFVVPPTEPSMIASDALPLFKLPTIEAFAILQTASGVTFVHFAASPAPAAPVCDIQLSQTSYANGESVTAQVLRVANPGASPVAIEYKMWIEVPGLGAFPYTRGGADGSVALPAGFDQDFGPVALFTVTPSLPRGVYTFGCRLVSPVTGESLGEHLNQFAVP